MTFAGKFRLAVLSSFALANVTALAFEVVDDGATFRIADAGGMVANGFVCAGSDRAADVRNAFVTLPDGTAVWNRWNEVRECRHRLEVARHPNGEVELTMAGQVAFDATNRERRVRLVIPASILDGKPWRSFTERLGRIDERKGVFGKDFVPLDSRWLATDGIVFDFNPLGCGDYYSWGGDGVWSHMDSVRGIWKVRREGDRYVFEAGTEVNVAWGGFVGAKLVMRKGSYEDHPKCHALRRFWYAEELPAVRRLAFGATGRGDRFEEGNRPYDPSQGFGWQGRCPEAVARTGTENGVYYGAVSGNARATYRIDGLSDGYHLVSLAFGNYAGVDNRFSLDVNGDRWIGQSSVCKREVRTVARAVRVTGGRLDIGFDGRWLVSMIAVQPLMMDAEDFTMRRKFWCVDGYEPSHLYRNCDLTPLKALPFRDETDVLPEPGREFAATPREPREEVELPDPGLASLDWTRNAVIYRLFNNSSSMGELDEPGALAKYLDREVGGKGVNAIMLSGMLSRHTYLGHEDRGIRAVKRVVDEAHRRGLKVIDHFDATLLWNTIHGFRVLAETLPQVNLSWEDHLPGLQYCIMNPTLRESFFRYLGKIVETGVDGLQIDEVYFWKHGCACRHCRKAFREDTGWTIPLDETNPAWHDDRSEFKRRWYAWRTKKCTDFLIEARRRLKRIKPDLVLSAYSCDNVFEGKYEWVYNGRDYFDLGRTVNFFGIEVMSRSVLKGFRYELMVRRMQNMLALAYDVPIWDWYYSFNWPTDYAAWTMSEMTGQTPLLSEIKDAAEGPDYVHFRGTGRAMVKKGARPIAEVGLLFSNGSKMNCDDSEMIGDLFGTAQALDALGTPYDVIGQMSLDAKHLAKYRVLFVGAAECLSDAEIGVIRDFAAQGGTVRLSSRAGTLDAYGKPRPSWPFGDVFGCAAGSLPSGEGLVSRPFGAGLFVYSAAPRGKGFDVGEIVEGDVYRYAATREEEEAFRKEVKAWTKGATWWTADLPAGVYASHWRENDGTVAIHFFNATGVKNVPGEKITVDAPKLPFPPLEKDIVFTVPEGCRAVAVSPDFVGERKLDAVSNRDGSLTVRLPREDLRAYVLVRVYVGARALSRQ